MNFAENFMCVKKVKKNEQLENTDENYRPRSINKQKWIAAVRELNLSVTNLTMIDEYLSSE